MRDNKGILRQIGKSPGMPFISSKKKGFRIGIDDYMVKPIEFDELLMRVEALLRRANILNERKLTIGNVVLDSDELAGNCGGFD